ncbi:MAG: cyanophycinase [Planctomycetota bacterium]|nr:cyanophycinase [Planctomycetota bacterium]
MKIPFVFAACSLLVACTLALKSAPPDAARPKGVLIAVGGGGTTPEIIERALMQAGGKSAAMLIVAQASSDPKSGEESRTFWMEHGATNVSVLDVSDPVAALLAIEKAAFIWMPGGDQKRLLEALETAKLVDAIVKRFHEGAVVGGTSAGAAAMSKLMIMGGDKADLKSVKAGATQTTDGLGLWPEVILDQHFVQRQRFTRMLACVLDHPEAIGVGIDEKTAVVVSGRSFEVIGESTVLVVDARAAKRVARADGELHSASDLKLHVLKRGDKFEWAAKSD